MPDPHLTPDALAAHIRDLLPHGDFTISFRRLETRIVIVAHCYCGRKLDMLDSLPSELLLLWLADHDHDAFLTEEQRRAKYEAVLAPVASARMAEVLDAYEIPQPLREAWQQIKEARDA